MASNAGTHLVTEALNHLTGTSTWTAPSTLFLCLLKSASAASDSTSTNSAKEVETPGQNGYARQSISLATEGSGQSISTNQLTFGAATANWAEVTHCWVTDSSSGGSGNIWLQGALTANKTVLNTGSIIFEIGEVVFSLS